jgi:hypothetical protein
MNRAMAQAADAGEGSIDTFGPCQRCGTLSIGIEKKGTFTFLCEAHTT